MKATITRLHDGRRVIAFERPPETWDAALGRMVDRFVVDLEQLRLAHEEAQHRSGEPVEFPIEFLE